MSTNSNQPPAKARSPCSATGSQGRAHALNPRDSGLDVVVGLRPTDHLAPGRPMASRWWNRPKP